MRKKDFVEEAVRDVAQLGANHLNQHPDTLVLADYLDDLLTASDQDDVREHLAFCSSCTQAVLRLQDGTMAQTEPIPPKPFRFWHSWLSLWQSPLMGLAQVALVLGLLTWNLYLQMERNQHNQPKLSHPIDLSPIDEAHEKGGVEERVSAPLGQVIDLFINTVNIQEQGPFDLDMDLGDGKTWTIANSVPSADGYLVVQIPFVLPKGEYGLALKNSKGEVLARYRWSIQ